MEPTKKHPTIGKYILLKTLGCGYNSKVKLGFDSTNNGYCAVKMIKHDHPTLNVKSLEKEIAVMQNLSHPNIVNLIDFIPSEDYHKKKKWNYLQSIGYCHGISSRRRTFRVRRRFWQIQ